MTRFALVVAVLLCGSAFADDFVRGYVKKDGTYVAPHYRTERNGTRNDNYSTRGNVNPYTGEYGTKPRDEDLPPYRPTRLDGTLSPPPTPQEQWGTLDRPQRRDYAGSYFVPDVPDVPDVPSVPEVPDYGGLNSYDLADE